MTFILCNSASFTQNFWLLSCPKQLTDVAGADAGSAGCKCQLADDQRPTCPSGSISGFQGTIRTQPGYWYYVVVQANPPDTGKDASRTFTVAAQPTVEGM